MAFKNIGKILGELRKARGLLLREVSAAIKTDPAILSKIERGERLPTKEQVIKLAKFFKADKNEFIIAWLSDKLVYEVTDEEFGLKAMQVAEEKVAYQTRSRIKKEYPRERKRIMRLLQQYFKKEKRVRSAWVFGSFARQEDTPGSDIDIMIAYSDKASGTLLDYADIQYNLQKILKCKVDLVEEGYVKPFAKDTIQKDLQLIYG